MPANAEILTQVAAAHEANGRTGRKSAKRTKRRVLSILMWTAFAMALAVASLLHWGGYLLISDESIGGHEDAAVVLQGSILGEQARVAGAVRVLQQGKADRILLSVPKESYWGQPIARIARAYIERTYTAEAASHLEFCEMDGVDSTEQEADSLLRCIDARHWHSVTIVTSNYHTRRTGILWRRMLQNQHSSLKVTIHAVPDPEFHPAGWWRDRRSAKSWLLESTKLLWTFMRK